MEPYEVSKMTRTPLVIWLPAEQMQQLWYEKGTDWHLLDRWDKKSDITLLSLPGIVFRLSGTIESTKEL